MERGREEVREMAKNPCGKTVDRKAAYEVWTSADGSWTWYVRKKYSGNDDAPYARWFCDVVSPFAPLGESGDVYVSEIKRNATKRGAAA